MCGSCSWVAIIFVVSVCACVVCAVLLRALLLLLLLLALLFGTVCTKWSSEWVRLAGLLRLGLKDKLVFSWRARVSHGGDSTSC